ncbi:MAG TPA: hypothetical protein VJX31_12920 [Casimicrobiaceae bacterium]|nr:hypothetical protein [Casimicrobiaceae bacterium]
MRFVFIVIVAALAAVVARDAAAVTIGGNPGPEHNYVCPHADGKPALECYFDAVAHLYTMCRNVKSIEVIEFGYEKSTEGTNGSKSEYCLDKQRQNIAQPYQAALKEAKVSKQAVEALRGLHEAWTLAMTQLTWRAGESDDDYKKRVALPYDDFKARIEGIRTIVAVVEKHTEPARAAKGSAKSKPKPQSKAKTS